MKLPKMSWNEAAHPEPTDSLMVPNIWVSDLTSVAAPSDVAASSCIATICASLKPFAESAAPSRSPEIAARVVVKTSDVSHSSERDSRKLLPLASHCVNDWSSGTFASVPIALPVSNRAVLNASPLMFAFSTDFQSMRRTVPAEIA